MTLTNNEENELRKVKLYFPFRKVAALKTLDGEFLIYANPTMHKVNAAARKLGGVIFTLGV